MNRKIYLKVMAVAGGFLAFVAGIIMLPGGVVISHVITWVVLIMIIAGVDGYICYCIDPLGLEDKNL